MTTQTILVITEHDNIVTNVNVSFSPLGQPVKVCDATRRVIAEAIDLPITSLPIMDVLARDEK